MDDCLVGGGGGESQLLGLPSFAIMVCMFCSSNVEYHVRILFLPHRIFCLKTKVLPSKANLQSYLQEKWSLFYPSSF